VIDLQLLRSDPSAVAAALARRGVDPVEVERIVELDVLHRSLLQDQEVLRAEVKSLSKEVGAARKAGDTERASAMADQSRTVGDEEREAAAEATVAGAALRSAMLVLPNLPSPDAPDGSSADENVELRRWWPGFDDGAPEPSYAEHQRVAHWEIGAQLGLLDMERGARLAGSMFPLYRGAGARLLRSLGAFALDAHTDAYEEIRPPTFALTETLTSTGHLPKFSDEAYQIERDDLWAIPTAEVPLTSMHRGEILAEADLPIRFTAQTACFRREAGAAGRDTRGLLRVHEFDKVELFAYTTPDQAHEAHLDILARAEALLRALGLHYRVLDLCAGDLGASSARTFDLEVYAPGCDRWLEVSSVSWFSDYQARRAQVRFRPDGGGSPQLCHTVNGSALAWARIWAAIVEQGRQSDGSVVLPDVLGPYLGGSVVVPAPST
jgi:seryl-tRNA synthetase